MRIGPFKISLANNNRAAPDRPSDHGPAVHQPAYAQYGSRRSMEPTLGLSRTHPQRGAENFAMGLERWTEGSTTPHGELVPLSKLKINKSNSKSVSSSIHNNKKPLKEGAIAKIEYRHEAAQRIIDAKKQRDEQLDLENLALTGLPVQIGDLNNVTALNANFNRLPSLPEQISQMAGIKSLELGINDIKYIPASIGNLKNLVRLDLSGNRLRELPKEIGDLTNLTSLLVDFNYLESLPAELSNLSGLRTLNASFNLLGAVPAKLGDLRALEKVDLSNTQIHTLPVSWHPVIEKIAQLNLSNTNFSGFHPDTPYPQNLALLDISRTQTKTLPAKFGTLTFWDSNNDDILRTTHKRSYFGNTKILIKDTNLAAELAREGRMSTSRPIAKLIPVRNELKNTAQARFDNDIDSEPDDGDNLHYQMEFVEGGMGFVDAEKDALRQQAMIDKLPIEGRVAEWAHATALEEARDHYMRADQQPEEPFNQNTWGNEPLPAWPGARPLPSARMQDPWAQSSMPVQRAGNFETAWAQPRPFQGEEHRFSSHPQFPATGPAPFRGGMPPAERTSDFAPQWQQPRHVQDDGQGFANPQRFPSMGPAPFRGGMPPERAGGYAAQPQQFRQVADDGYGPPRRQPSPAPFGAGSGSDWRMGTDHINPLSSMYPPARISQPPASQNHSAWR